MNNKGGHVIRLSNPPQGKVICPDMPEMLYVSRNLNNVNFDEVMVAPGQQISAGQILANASSHCNMPLTSPLAGKIEAITNDEIIINEIYGDIDCSITIGQDNLDNLFNFGGFRYITNPFDSTIADKSTPENIIARLAAKDSYVMGSEIDLIGEIPELCNGLQSLSKLANNKLHIVVTKKQKKLLSKLKSYLNDNDKISFMVIPDRYGFDNDKLLAMTLGLSPEMVNWSINTQGVFAVDKIINQQKLSNDLYISVAGPAVSNPYYCHIPIGYPVDKLLDGKLNQTNDIRIINGGVFTGRKIDNTEHGLAGNTTGITVLDDSVKRKLLKFARFGFDDTRFEDDLSTDMQGELRACVSCGYCQQKCPAGLLPDYLHKLLYNDDLDKAEAAGLNRCVGCGLCSFICVSKIDLADQFAKAQYQLAQEKAQLALEGDK